RQTLVCRHPFATAHGVERQLDASRAVIMALAAVVRQDEERAVSVALGDTAKIEVDALPDITFAGVVTEIANSAKISGAGSSDEKTEFEVKISLLEPGSELRPGMTASGDIVTETKNEVLSVPIQCVAVRTPKQLQRKMASNGEAIAGDSLDQKYTPDEDGYVEVVFVIDGAKANAKQVKTGIQSETHIEIVDGLPEGSEIVTGSYSAISKDLQNGSAVVVSNNEKNE
ncbi:hypothetical protein IH799_04680, partial [candidate division KSB1 bacterium]|nr:hypothetical protein [candidate division KSB1 bacterium]